MVLGYKHNISCSFRYHHPGQSVEWNQRAYGSDHFSRGVGVNLSFWSWWQQNGKAESLRLKKLLDHRWLFEDAATTPEKLLLKLEAESGADCLGLCLIESESWAVATDKKNLYLVYRVKDFTEEIEFYFSKSADELSGLVLLREEARHLAKDYIEKNTGFSPPMVGYRQQRRVGAQVIGQTKEAVQHGVLFPFPIVWP